jgi:pimeloyl-ACP methyl ester carboxylesterase
VKRKDVGVISALLGAAAGLAAGVAAERVLLRRTIRVVEDPYAAELFDRLPFDEQRTIVTEDDVNIYVEIVDDELGGDEKSTKKPTIIFVHGFCLDMGTFHFQRQALQGKYRMVFFDQPGHGRSGRLAAGEYDLVALASPLRRVIEETTPTGPLILVGHSMGAMVIMALAERWPELVRQRVVAAALINTSSGGLNEVTFGLPALLGKPIVPVITAAGRFTPRAVDRARRSSTNLFWMLTRAYGFGGPRPSRALVSYVEQMISRTSVEIIARYLRTLMSHARSSALLAFENAEVLVVAGDRDLFTPLTHSEEICRVLPHAELLTIENAGHLSLLEYPKPVTEALAELLSRIKSDVPKGRAKRRGR